MSKKVKAKSARKVTKQKAKRASAVAKVKSALPAPQPRVEARGEAQVQELDERGYYPVVDELRRHLRAYGYTAEGAAARRDFAKRCGTKLTYLVQLGLGYRRASLALALTIEKESHGLVPARALAPQADWAFIEKREKRRAAPATVAA